MKATAIKPTKTTTPTRIPKLMRRAIEEVRNAPQKELAPISCELSTKSSATITAMGKAIAKMEGWEQWRGESAALTFILTSALTGYNRGLGLKALKG